jgi:hypothetical protein
MYATCKFLQFVIFKPVLWNRNYFLQVRFRFRLLKIYGSGSGSNFCKSYGYGSGSISQKVMVPTVPVPQHSVKPLDQDPQQRPIGTDKSCVFRERDFSPESSGSDSGSWEEIEAAKK